MDQIDLLRLFVAIADHGSLSAAARARGQAPSTLTLGLQQLERRVGARLVHRTTRRLSLTAEGERFLTDCRRILADLNEVLDGVAEHGPLQGEIRLTATNDLGRARIAPLLHRFMALNPGVRIQLTLTDAVLDLAEEGYDLAIRMGPLADSTLVARRLMAGSRRVCAAPIYWARHGRPEHPRELAQHNCLILSRPGAPQTQWRFRTPQGPLNVRINGDRSANDGGVLREWAVAGAGVVLKSSVDVAADLAAGRLETALDDFAPEHIDLYAVYTSGRRPARRVQALIAFLSDQMRDTD